MTIKQSVLFADSARGIYIPQHFAESIDVEKWKYVTTEDLDILRAGPDHDDYWEAWDCVLNDAETTDGGVLHQDGDLWLIYADAARDAINAHCESQREYEEEHQDAGNNYAHMPRESWTSESTNRLIEQMRESDLPIDPRWAQLESDVVADCALESFKMESRHQFHIEGNSITLESYPIGEIEIDLSDVGVDGVALEYASGSCDVHINGSLAYVSSDCLWAAVLDVEQFNAEIAARFE